MQEKGTPPYEVLINQVKVVVSSGSISTKSAFTSSKLTIGTLEKGVKYLQKYQ